MKHQLQLELLDRIFAHLDQKTTDTSADLLHVPASNYADPSQLKVEKQSLFNRMPRFVGLSCLLPEANSYCCDDNYDQPLLLVRDADSRFRAFRNTCRHRGTRLAEGAGMNQRRFTCPYHGWTYSAGGQLVAIPSESHFSGLNKTQCNLIEFTAIESNGMLWVMPDANPETAARDIEQFLAGLGDDLGQFKLGEHHHYQNREMALDLNWKLVIDTFLEPYHFPVLHKDTVGPIFFPNLCLFDAFGAHLREILPRRSIEKLRDTPREGWDLIPHSAIVYVLFPNTVLVVQIDHIEIWRSFPDAADPNKSRVLLDFYIPEPATTDKARRHWDANMDLTVKTVLEEDFPTNAGAQAGYRADEAPDLVFGRNEPALVHFESMIQRYRS